MQKEQWRLVKKNAEFRFDVYVFMVHLGKNKKKIGRAITTYKNFENFKF